jgi:hypothetical protein
MRLELAEAIVEENPSLTLHREYSGRGMMGQTTAGVSGSLVDFVAALVMIAQIKEITDEIGHIDMRDLQYDSLGNDIIFY